MSSQTSDILKRLKKHGWIDMHVAQKLYGIKALSQRITELRNRGETIYTEMVPFVNRHGRKGKFARYHYARKAA